MNQAELILNIEATAAKLCGRVVMVRIRHYEGVSGLAQRDLNGRAVIDLDPALLDPCNVKEFAMTFAHEAAHILKHFDQLPGRDIDKGIDREISRARVHLATGTAYKQHESEADTQAARWMKAVNRLYPFYSSGADPFITVLRILYHHSDD